MFRKWLDDTPDRFDNNEIVSTAKWLAILTVAMVPVMNIVFFLYWALHSRDDEYPASLVNFARAALIMMLIVTFATAGVILLGGVLGVWERFLVNN